MLWVAGVLGVSLLVRASPPLVRTIEVAEVACTRDGWCTELPWPLDVATAEADERRLVAGSTGGSLVLYEGTWRDGVDSGLERVTHIRLEDDRVHACDARRCVDVAIVDGGFGKVVEAGAPSRAAQARSTSGIFGEGGRYELKGERVHAFHNGRRVLSRQATGALGASGSPLWVVHGSMVTRYSDDGGSPVGRQERLPIFCFVWCEGWNGRLFGSADAPVLQLHHHAGEGLYHHDGTRFAPLHEPGFGGYKEPAAAVLGEGCSPCVVGAWQVAIRRADRWVIVSFPDVNAPMASRAHSIGLDEEGWPTILFNLAHGDEPERLEAWSFDGTRWMKGAKAKTVRVGSPGNEPAAKRPTWTESYRSHDVGCTARTPWGERWAIHGGMLTVEGAGRKRVERLPQQVRFCDVVPGERGVFILVGLTGGVLSKKWEDFAIGARVERENFRVTEVAMDDRLHVRRGADPAAGIIASLPPGACVEGVGLRTSGRGGHWLKVRAGDGTEGWASARFLRAEPCAP
jgi:hypothetical protein